MVFLNLFKRKASLLPENQIFSSKDNKNSPVNTNSHLRIHLQNNAELNNLNILKGNKKNFEEIKSNKNITLIESPKDSTIKGKVNKLITLKFLFKI